MNRRTLLAAAISFPIVTWSHRALTQNSALQFQYPIAWPGEIAGDGFIIRHGYACENTWYNPGYLHTGEDWYAIDGETAGAEIRAIAAGTVAFAGSDYPGRVVIIQHEPDLFSMYGHLDYALDIAEGNSIESGERIGTVLFRTDGAAPSHLHFEVRTFLTTPEVNGDRPRYGFGCGYNCPPGPGYWPIDAPEHPSAMGWRNPTHVIARHMFLDGEPPVGFKVVVAEGIKHSASLWSLPSDRRDSETTGELELAGGDRYPLVSVAAGTESTGGWGAERYRLWYRIELPNGDTPWIQAAEPSAIETGSDGSSSALALVIIPNITND